jgi:septal ring factor EnvC (AmiA/AmiB activator)
MSTKDNFDNLFGGLKGQFDHEEPNKGHESRFLEKLEANTDNKNEIKSKSFWKPFLVIAASIVICFIVFNTFNTSEEKLDLASVSPELSEAREFFTATITEELKKLDAERSPLTENIIYEAERQLKTLETDYDALKNDLIESGNDKRVIYAMISNFQNRIEILENILDQIDDLKEIQNETEITL